MQKEHKNQALDNDQEFGLEEREGDFDDMHEIDFGAVDFPDSDPFPGSVPFLDEVIYPDL